MLLIQEIDQESGRSESNGSSVERIYQQNDAQRHQELEACQSKPQILSIAHEYD